jgi:signal transduction histidine kinase/ActR/RegA family two-component response regulator
MPRWLQRDVLSRPLEALADFLRLAARTASLEEVLQQACAGLGHLFGAEAVVFFQLDSGGKRLEPQAAFPPECEPGGPVSLQAVPEWRAALAEGASRWLEGSTASPPALFSPLPEAHRVLLLPVAARARAYGCVAVFFARRADPPGTEGRQAGQALAHALSLLFEARRLDDEDKARRRRYEFGSYGDCAPLHPLGDKDKMVQRERLATLGELISGIAHELNNPLTAVTGYAELLLADGLPPEAREKVARLGEEAERANRILKSLLLFARGEEAERQPVDLNELLERTLALRAYELKVENIQIVRHYAPDLPPVLADATPLQQVFLNLLLNAEQAIRSQRAQGRITLRTRWQPEEAQVVVEITDDGPGIPPVIQPCIFDPFFTTKEGPEGTGLGLSISQVIVKDHGGDITLESAPGRGATFSVKLGVPPLPPPPLAAPARPRARRAGRAGQRILVVDDEPVVAHLIADTLRKQGFVVRVDTDSRRALEAACREPFELVICDVRMPELDGPAFHRLLSERRPELACRLLFTTGDTLARETIRFLEQVRLPHIAKPFHVDELQTVVAEVLGELERTAENADSTGAH